VTTRLSFTVVLMLASSSAGADPKADAKAHIEKATAAHAAGKYDDALRELTLAYALDPQPELLFGIGQVHMKLGDCESATTFYQRFIATKPNPKAAAIAQKAITTCKDHPPEPKKVEPEPVVEPAKPPPVETKPEPVAVIPPPPPPEQRPWYRDVVGDALVGLGVVAEAVAVVEYRGALDKRDRADAAMNYGDYQKLLDDAHHQNRFAIGFAAGGGALVLAGVIHYIVSGKPEEHGVAIVPTHGGNLVTWTTRF